MKRLLAILLLFTLGAFVKPPDVPDYVDTTTNMYQSGTTLNKLGNGIDADGGTPPAAAYELADIPASPIGWSTNAPQGTSNFCALVGLGGTCVQAKARFNANVTHVLKDDPIRNYGQPGTSHCHTFFGNGSANAYSTFASLRANSAKYSASSGGALNGTAYWYPCIIKPNAFGDGKDYVVKPDFVIFYYTAPSVASTANLTYLLQGLRYVSGFNMDDGIGGEKLGQWLQDKVDEANAQPGTSGRYSIYHSGINGISWAWTCNSQAIKYRLANAAGDDPFTGCTAGKQLVLQFSGAGCWDGINFWSPGGYKHVIPKVWDEVANGFVCPNAWYELPVLQIELSFTHSGPADYTTWKCASDPDGVDHCSTFHTDWMNGWDRTTLHSWLDECLGVNATPHECNNSTVGPSLRLYRAEMGLTGRFPQVNITSGTWNTTDPSKMWLVPTSPGGPKTLHIHGG